MIIRLLIITLLCTIIMPPLNGQTSNEVLPLHSEAVLLMNKDTGDVLFEVDSEKTMYPASITKIVTGIVAIEEGDLESIATVSEEATKVIGTRVYLVKDEQITLRKLIQGLLINSGNDAGTVIAEHLDGSEEQFAKRMTEFAHRLGATSTNFTNPHGLFDEHHYTTAKDMALITKYAMQNEVFRDIVGTKELEWDGQEWQTTLYNHHRLLWDYDGTTGVKNGYVHKSGYTLVTTATKEGTGLLVVTLNAPSSRHAYADTRKLFDYGFNHFQTNRLDEGRRFVSENGTSFYLREEIAYTSEKDMFVNLVVSNDGVLTLYRPDKTVIRRQQLHLSEEEEAALAVMSATLENGEKVTTKSKSIWQRILSFFQGFFTKEH